MSGFWRSVRVKVNRYAVAAEQRSTVVPRLLERRIDLIAAIWCGTFLSACLAKLLLSPTPIHGARDLLEIAIPYLCIALGPVAGYRLALAAFPAGAVFAQPGTRWSIVGKWRPLPATDARADPAFGPAGFVASLLVGLLLTVVLRSFEFLFAMPALNSHAPAWGAALFRWLAFDIAVMSFFYAVCFIMALRGVPLFPRMLLFVWLLDVVAQLILAHRLGLLTGLPPSVAVALRGVIIGNIWKVLISAFVWLPYLILSDRVNVTYRQRVRDR